MRQRRPELDLMSSRGRQIYESNEEQLRVAELEASAAVKAEAGEGGPTMALLRN